MNLSAFFPLMTLIVSQLIGEWISATFQLPLPGAVVGAVLLFIALCLVPGLHAKIAPFAHTLLRNMLLFYVPASVGIMVTFGEIASRGPFLLIVTVVSTWMTAFVSAVVFDSFRSRSEEPAP
ncbi:CidA/LrgA family protein [Bremerella cremea]|uniref:CidA/LrgA family protein n=1 Tax=Bremerella cremea TaxID=1031537 RepID=UPI0031E63344